MANQTTCTVGVSLGDRGDSESGESPHQWRSLQDMELGRDPKQRKGIAAIETKLSVSGGSQHLAKSNEQRPITQQSIDRLLRTATLVADKRRGRGEGLGDQASGGAGQTEERATESGDNDIAHRVEHTTAAHNDDQGGGDEGSDSEHGKRRPHSAYRRTCGSDPTRRDGHLSDDLLCFAPRADELGRWSRAAAMGWRERRAVSAAAEGEIEFAAGQRTRTG
ncbi:hypothetical protein MMC19_000407 [Ptychographa xylographoides]|nr:hypothetical protein [Ptychographa xylographoides]